MRLEALSVAMGAMAGEACPKLRIKLVLKELITAHQGSDRNYLYTMVFIRILLGLYKDFTGIASGFKASRGLRGYSTRSDLDHSPPIESCDAWHPFLNLWLNLILFEVPTNHEMEVLGSPRKSFAFLRVPSLWLERLPGIFPGIPWNSYEFLRVPSNS